jgi:2-oxo-3-hexenedioate decarboxylase
LSPDEASLRHRHEPPALASCEHRRLADVLLRAARTGRAIPRLTEANSELNVADACRIRDMLLARRISEGDQVIGAEVWLGRAPAETCRWASDPQLGWLTDRMLLSSGVVDLSRLIHPRVEPRLGFLLGRPLREPIEAASDLLAATDRVLPCLEIVDHRYDGARPRLADVVADNCATSGLLLGHGVRPLADGHLRRLRVRLKAEGAVWAPPAVRADAVVPPLEAATWLANQLLQGGNRPERGTLLVCPVAGGSVELLPGVRVTARFRDIGDLDLRALDAGPARRARHAGSPASALAH